MWEGKEMGEPAKVAKHIEKHRIRQNISTKVSSEAILQGPDQRSLRRELRLQK